MANKERYVRKVATEFSNLNNFHVIATTKNRSLRSKVTEDKNLLRRQVYQKSTASTHNDFYYSYAGWGPVNRGFQGKIGKRKLSVWIRKPATHTTRTLVNRAFMDRFFTAPHKWVDIFVAAATAEEEWNPLNSHNHQPRSTIGLATCDHNNSRSGGGH